MASDPAPENLSADQPLVTPDQDRLGYAAFARHVTGAIGAAPADGLVVGLHGGSGTGRSSVASFVRHNLAGAGTPVIEFNPWLLGVELDICERFLAQLEQALGGAGGERAADDGQARARLARTLRSQGSRIVVVMDDLDRLSPAGMREAGRLVRSVGALPNLVYLLVLDRQGRDAGEVSRIVQLPLDMPLAEPGALSQFFLDQFRELLDRHPAPRVVTQRHFDQAFSPGIETLLSTPRDVVRLINALRVSYPPISEEVNTADFVAIEAVRLFLPGLWDVIRRNPHGFAGSSRPRSAAAVDPETKQFHEAWREALDPSVQLGVTTLVLRLFPSVPDFEGLVIQRDSPSDAARQELRVASRELFTAYFRLAVPATTLSNAEMEALLVEADSADGFAALLVRLAGEEPAGGGGRLPQFLGRLSDIVPGISAEQAGPAVGGILEAGDRIGVEQDERLASLLEALLGRLDPGPRLVLLRAEMARRHGVGLIVAEVARLGREHGRHGGTHEVPAGGPVVDLEGLAALEQVALARIREAAASGRLLDVPRLPVVLGRWRVWDRNECMRWVSQTAANDDSLIELLTSFLQQGRDPYAADAGLHGPHRFDLDGLSSVLAAEQIADRVRRLARERAGTGIAQAALDQFVVEYDARQDGGEAATASGREVATDAEE